MGDWNLNQLRCAKNQYPILTRTGPNGIEKWFHKTNKLHITRNYKVNLHKLPNQYYQSMSEDMTDFAYSSK